MREAGRIILGQTSSAVSCKAGPADQGRSLNAIERHSDILTFTCISYRDNQHTQDSQLYFLSFLIQLQ